MDATGRVVDADIVRSSKSRRLDAQALTIVRAAAPFGAFNPAMRAQAAIALATQQRLADRLYARWLGKTSDG